MESRMEDPSMAVRKTKVDWRNVTKQKTSDDASIGSDPERVQFYNDNAEIYNDDMVEYDYNGATVTANNLHKYLKGNIDAKILDVGGGTGSVITELRKLAPYSNADGLDPAGKMLEIGKEEGLYNNIFPQYFVVGSGMEHNCYDAICSSAAFVPGHIKSETVKEMYQLLKPGGFVVLSLRHSHMEHDEDLSTLRPLIKQMSVEGKFAIREDYLFDNFFAGHTGQEFVLEKLC